MRVAQLSKASFAVVLLLGIPPPASAPHSRGIPLTRLQADECGGL